MPAIPRILLPVDFSPRGEGALRCAAALARHFRSELTVLHALEILPWVAQTGFAYESGFPAEAITALQDQRKAELETYGADEFRNLRVKRVMLTGSPADVIISQAEKEDTSLIVMPTRGAGPFRRFLMGSVTTKVLHDAACPVWTGTHLEEAPQIEWKTIRNVVCAIDGRPESAQVLRWAADFNAEFGARFTILRAVPRLPPAAHDFFDPEYGRTLAAQARDQVEIAKKAAGVLSGEILIVEGEPAKVVPETAKSLDADLLVIGRTSTEGLERRLLENAYPIIRQSPCPVVSV